MISLFWLFAVLFGAGFLVQVYFPVIIHWKLRVHKDGDQAPGVPPPVSIIICARNEQANLAQNLPSVLGQEYPDFEVVVVNDCSFDESEQVLKELGAKYEHLRVVTIAEHERYKHGKKFAVTLGIKRSQNELLLFTDADCRPSSPLWLERMASGFGGQKEIVLGFSPYEKQPGFLNRLIRFETFYTAVNYLSYALCGNPYMGVGRNLAYKKDLFFKGKGFASHMHIQSGDDDLFVNQNANAGNTSIAIHPDAHTFSSPKKSYAAYFNQKVRHYGAGSAYRPQHKRMLAVQTVSGLVFYLSAIGAFITAGSFWPFILAGLGLKWLIQVVVLVPVAKKLNSADLIFWLPVLDIIYYFYLAFFSVATLFKKKVQWK